MKKAILLVMLIIVGLLYIGTSCKKDSGNDSKDSSIVNKWTYVNRVEWSTPDGGTTDKDTANYPVGSYADFRSDGKVYSYIPNYGVDEYDTANYQFDNNTLILLRKTGEIDTLTVQTLTSNSFVTYIKDFFPGGSAEVWTNLTR